MSLPAGFIQIDLFAVDDPEPAPKPKPKPVKKIQAEVTLHELYQKANEFCQEHWGVEFTGRIEISNTKWRRRLACFYPHGLIRFSRVRNLTQTREQIYDTLLHELVHWRLFKTGQPYDDTDPEFVRECLRVGAVLSGAKKAKEAAKKYENKYEIRAETKQKPKPKRRRRKKGIVYRCPRCKKSIEIDIPAVAIVCGCGRRMERSEGK